MPEEIRTDITKQEAARRQLETAITLLYWEGDDVSIHVLAGSAAEILTDVCARKGISGFRATADEYIKPEYRPEFARKLKEAYNYFKHADRDAFKELGRFNPAANEMLLFTCCHDYALAFGWPLPPVLLVFFCCYLAANPSMIKEDFPHKDILLIRFAEYGAKTPAERRSSCRELLKAYTDSLDEELPIRGLQDAR